VDLIKAIIVDDEQSARNVLRSLLERSNSRISVVGESENVPEAVELIHAVQPDVVFIDIEMPIYAGYEIISFFEEINFKIIFVTAYDQYAIKAFELNAIDYLMKPINRTRLNEAITKIESVITKENDIVEYKSLLQSLQDSEQNSLVLTDSGSKKIVKLSDIIAFEGHGAYCKIFLNDGKSYVESKNLKKFEEFLSLEDDFFRTHKSWLINMTQVKEFSLAELKIKMKNDLVVKLSKFKKQEFKNLVSS
jgi:two-component system LytT family response regulator